MSEKRGGASQPGAPEVAQNQERAAIDKELATHAKWFEDFKKDKKSKDGAREALQILKEASSVLPDSPKKTAALEFLAAHESEMHGGGSKKEKKMIAEGRDNKKIKSREVKVVEDKGGKKGLKKEKRIDKERMGKQLAELHEQGAVVVEAEEKIKVVPKVVTPAVVEKAEEEEKKENVSDKKEETESATEKKEEAKEVEGRKPFELVRAALSSNVSADIARIITENFFSELKPTEWAEPEKHKEKIKSLVEDVRGIIENRFRRLSQVLAKEELTGREARIIAEKYYSEVSKENFNDAEKLKAKVAPILLEVRHAANERLAEFRQALPEWFSSVVVREKGKEGEKKANLDSRACIFMLEKVLGMGKADATQKERDFVDPKNIRYVKIGETVPGGLHLNMSPGVHGGAMFEGAGFVDHHGKESPRRSSAFGEMYRQLSEAGDLDFLNKEAEQALGKIAKFVTMIDSYTLPGREEIGNEKLTWSDAWKNSDQTVFGLVMANQDDFSVGALANFFWAHNLKDAFVPGKIKELPEEYKTKVEKMSASLTATKEKIDRSLKLASAEKWKVGSSVDSKLGRLLVYVQDSKKDRIPELQFAALGNGYSGVLIWKPGQKSFFLGVGPGVVIPEDVAGLFGETAVNVRHGMLMKKKEVNSTLSLGEVLSKIGVDVGQLQQKIVDGKNTDNNRFFDEIKSAPVEISAVEPPEIVGGQIIGEGKQEIKEPGEEVGAVVETGVRVNVEIPVAEEKDVSVSPASKVEEPLPQEVDLPISEFLPEESERIMREAEILREKVSKLLENPAPSPEEFTLSAPEIPTAELPKVPSPARLEIPENADITESEGYLNEARQNYLEKLKDYETAKVRRGFLQRVEDEPWKIWKWFKSQKGEKIDDSGLSELKIQIEVAKRQYAEARNNYAADLCNAKEQELIDRGLSPEEIEDEMKRFRLQAVLEGLCVNEQGALQQAQVAEQPEKKKGVMRKCWNWYAKQNFAVRTLLTTGILTGVILGGSAVAGGITLASAVEFMSLSFLRALGAAVAAKGVGEVIGRGGGKLIRMGHEKKMAGLKQEISATKESDFFTLSDAFGKQIEKYNNLLKNKAKKENILLAGKIAAMVGIGFGASMEISSVWQSHASASELAQVKANVSAEVSHTQQLQQAETMKAAVADWQKQIEDFATAARSKGQSLAEAFKEKVLDFGTGFKETFDTGHLQDLATLHQGEGVISTFTRQLESFPEKFGFTGDVNNTADLHSWAVHNAEQIAIKQGYWDPSTGDQKWFVYNPKAPIKFVLDGDVKSGFGVQEMGTSGKEVIHHGGLNEFTKEGFKSAAFDEHVIARPHQVEGVVHSAPEPEFTSAQFDAEDIERAHKAMAEVVSAPVAESAQSAVSIDSYPEPTRPYVQAAQELVVKYAGVPAYDSTAKDLFDQIKIEATNLAKNADLVKVSKDAFKEQLEKIILAKTEITKEVVDSAVTIQPMDIKIGDSLIHLTHGPKGNTVDISEFLENNLYHYSQVRFLEKTGLFAKGFDFTQFGGSTYDSAQHSLTELVGYHKLLDQLSPASPYATTVRKAVKATMKVLVEQSASHNPKDLFNPSLIKEFWKL